MSERIAIVDGHGAHTYRALEAASRRVAGALLGGAADLAETRVAYFVAPGFGHAAVQRGIWRAGGVAVPLALSHPPAELAYVLQDSGASAVVTDEHVAATLAPLAGERDARCITTTMALAGTAPAALPAVTSGRRAMIVYTSGTTGRPKGAVTTHANIEAQVGTLVQAWGWSDRDRILLVLPLHHVHGIINGLGSALAAGAVCEMPGVFDAAAVWGRFASGEVTVFTAVPTIYHRLIAVWEQAPADRQEAWAAGARGVRLMMSGSAALPVRTLERWRGITGHTLLERYGMTEIGMALSNPLVGDRRPGCVGAPLPGTEVRLVDESGTSVPDGMPGELEVRGPSVFLEYWQRPDETQRAFRDGWFRTGDVAIVDGGAFRLLGRTSVDIIKTGGYKVSALEVEEVLRTHPAIAECAVVGVDDPEWGERVSVAVELNPDARLSLDDLQRWAGSRLAPYKVPRALCAVAALPRNAMGKVVKPDVAAFFHER